ncbi:hypothetical protein, partial [Xanthomonas translucens]|uniref:hypothetical protein n=1 Tax=Xanthomonas campestris pv. translucens TaxID=343 RepID=UPI001E4B5177
MRKVKDPVRHAGVSLPSVWLSALCVRRAFFGFRRFFAVLAMPPFLNGLRKGGELVYGKEPGSLTRFLATLSLGLPAMRGISPPAPPERRHVDGRPLDRGRFAGNSLQW